MTNERWLITGAFGCIGAWTVKRLLAENANVWTYDLPGNPHRLNLIMEPAEVAKVNMLEGDITDQVGFETAVTENGITHIIHLAALQVPFVRADPVKGMHINVVGSTIVFETAKRHIAQIQGLSYASSVAVYGPANLYPAGPLQHDAPLAPATLYGVSKVADEWSAKVYWQDYQLKTVGLRPFFVYGPGRDQGVSSMPTKAMLAAAAGRPYYINFNGAAIFQHADDVAKAFILAARADLEGAPVYNLAGTQATIDQVVDAIEAAAPEMEGGITHAIDKMPFAEDVDGAPAENAIGAIGWRPFNQGVADTIAAFRDAIAQNRIDVDRAIA